ncbi:MAG: hypothetical protein WD360_05015 [Nitriliruptoraceae bacterium]
MTNQVWQPSVRVSCADDCWLRLKAEHVTTSIGGILLDAGAGDDITAGNADLLVVAGTAANPMDDEQFMRAAVLERTDPREGLVTRTGGSLVDVTRQRTATVLVVAASTRVQLAQRAPDITVLPVASAEAALRAVQHGEVAALIAPIPWLRANSALAPGLAVRPLEHGEILHAAGSGIASLLCRRTDARTRKAVAVLDNAQSRAALTAERELQFHVTGDQADTDMYVAGHAEMRRTANGDERLVLLGLLLTQGGYGPYRASHEVGSADATVLGRAMAATLLAQYQQAHDRRTSSQHSHSTANRGH